MINLKDRVLKEQIAVIERISNLERPYTKIVAGLNLTVFPKVYHSGTDTALMCEKMEKHTLPGPLLVIENFY